MSLIVLKLMLGLKKLIFRAVTVLKTSVILGMKTAGDAMTSRNFILQYCFVEEQFVNLNSDMNKITFSINLSSVLKTLVPFMAREMWYLRIHELVTEDFCF
jgi:hypothetical protein